MQNVQLPALLALVLGLTGPVEAQNWRDRLNQGAEQVREGAGRVVTNVERSVQGTVELMTDEATPDETRTELDAMAYHTLERLFAEQPGAAALFEEAAGYSVFDTRRLVLVGLAAGAGRGVAVSKTTGERVYMNMGSGGFGMSLGFGGFETQVVMLFQTDPVYEDFVTRGLDATAEAGSMFGEDRTRAAVKFADGRSIFYLTDSGWKVSATAAGTRYWRDVDLNAPAPDPDLVPATPFPPEADAMAPAADPSFAPATPFPPEADAMAPAPEPLMADPAR